MLILAFWSTFFIYSHSDFFNDLVFFSFFSQDGETLLKKIDEVRLLESRKSARLINSDTDFSKLADVSLSANPCDDNNKASKKAAINAFTFKSKAIEVPRSDYVQISGYVFILLLSLSFQN